jgi:hypothetical protein
MLREAAHHSKARRPMCPVVKLAISGLLQSSSCKSAVFCLRIRRPRRGWRIRVKLTESGNHGTSYNPDSLHGVANRQSSTNVNFLILLRNLHLVLVEDRSDSRITAAMLTIFGIPAALLIISIFFPPTLLLTAPLCAYLFDRKGLRRYPNQNWLTGLTGLSRGWEVAYKTPGRTHTQRHHEALKRHQVIRIGPNWLSFGRAQAAKDIYGYTSACVKARPYDLLADGGANLNNISDKGLHSARRRMVASSYAPKNIPNWEPMVYDSVAALRAQLDRRTTRPLAPGEVPDAGDLTWDGVRWIFLYSVETIIKIMLSKETYFLDRGSDLIEIKTSKGTPRFINTVESIHSVQRAASTIICKLLTSCTDPHG